MSEQSHPEAHKQQDPSTRQVAMRSEILDAHHAEMHQVPMNATPYAIDEPFEKTGVINDNEGVAQELYAVIRAGNEMFGVVKTAVAEGGREHHHAAKKHILTRFGKDGQRASVVGALEPGNITDVGRNHQEGLGDAVSRNHFRIGVNESGELVMEDLGSTNGTELLIPGQNQATGESVRTSPLRTFSVWAPKSQDMKATALGNHGGNTEDRLQPIVKPGEQAASQVSDNERIAKLEADHQQREQELADQLSMLEEPFSEEERFALWQYSAGIMNKRKAQKEGNGEASIAHEQEAGQALRKLPAAGREAAQEYLRLMQQLEKVRGL